MSEKLDEIAKKLVLSKANIVNLAVMNFLQRVVILALTVGIVMRTEKIKPLANTTSSR